MASQTPYFTQRTDESKRQKSILVIEHHPAITELLVSALSLSEYGSSSIDAMDILSPTGIENRIEASPDGIILDVDIRSMLFKKPVDFIHAFYLQWQDAFLCAPMPPLILLTTQSMVCEELLREGYVVVMKPFKPHILLSLVKAATEQKALWRMNDAWS